MRRSRLLFLLAVILAVGALGYSALRPHVPTTEPFLTGEITRLDDGRRVLVSESPTAANASQCWFTLTEKSLVFRGDSRASAADLSGGQAVKVWQTGPILESFPCQTTATAIQIQPGQ